MKPCWLLPACTLAFMALACSEGDSSATITHPSSATFTTTGTIEQQYAADYANFAASSYKAKYETAGTYSDPEEDHEVTWFKDSNKRFRYDIDGDWSDAEIQLDGLSIFLDASGPMALCSSGDNIGEGGGCCGDECADRGANFVFYVAFPLALPNPREIDVEGLEILETSMESIAGFEARCYAFKEASDSRTRVCYSADGVQIAYSYEDSAGGTSRTIQSVETVENRDFELPFPLVTPVPE